MSSSRRVSCLDLTSKLNPTPRTPDQPVSETDEYAECIIIDDDKDDKFEEFPDSEITDYGLIIENKTDNHNEWHMENANGESLTPLHQNDLRQPRLDQEP